MFWICSSKFGAPLRLIHLSMYTTDFQLEYVLEDSGFYDFFNASRIDMKLPWLNRPVHGDTKDQRCAFPFPQ